MEPPISEVVTSIQTLEGLAGLEKTFYKLVYASGFIDADYETSFISPEDSTGG